MKAKWSISYLLGEDFIPITESNFPDDQVEVYMGFYESPSYIIWYARPWPDKPRWFNVADKFIFFLTVGDSSFFNDMFVVKSVIFDVSNSVWIIKAISQNWDTLAIKNKGIKYFNYDKEVNGGVLIKDIVGSVIPFMGMGMEDDELENHSLIKYKRVVFNKDTSPLDMVIKICRENRWEWYLDSNGLFVSPSLNLKKGINLDALPEEPEHYLIAEHTNFFSVTMSAYATRPMLRWNDDSRIIWVRYHLGANIGDMMTIFAQKCVDIPPTTVEEIESSIDAGSFFEFKKQLEDNAFFSYIDEKTFIDTLPGDARMYALQYYKENLRQFPILAGATFGEITSENIENYTHPRFSADLKKNTKDWETREYFRDDYGDNNIATQYAQDIRRTTPFAGSGAGMLFPQVDSHNVMYAPNGEMDMGLVGPAFFAEDDAIPARASGADFRLQLPGSGAMYWDSNRQRWYIEGNSILLGNRPTDFNNTPNWVGTYRPNQCVPDAEQDSACINVYNSNSIVMKNNKSRIFLFEGGCIHLENMEGNYKVHLSADTSKIYFAGAEVVFDVGEITFNGKVIMAQDLDVGGQINGNVVGSAGGGKMAGKIPSVSGTPVVALEGTEPPKDTEDET